MPRMELQPPPTAPTAAVLSKACQVPSPRSRPCPTTSRRYLSPSATRIAFRRLIAPNSNDNRLFSELYKICLSARRAVRYDLACKLTSFADSTLRIRLGTRALEPFGER